MSTHDGESSGNWTTGLRRRLSRTVPPGQLLPDRQPAYVQSWIYVFGVGLPGRTRVGHRIWRVVDR